MASTLKDQKYSSQRHSSQQKRQHPIHELQEYSFQNDILNVEKIKLQEELDYFQQRTRELSEELTNSVSIKDQEIMSLNSKIHQLENVNNQLLQRLQHQKKSEEYLSNANHHVTALQKKLDCANNENNQLQHKINSLQAQNLQLSNKWQKCSSQLKQQITTKSRVKESEDQLQKRSEEYANLKEKYVSCTLELTIMKQAEQEFKNNVQSKIKLLVDQLKECESQRNMLQNLLQEQRPTHSDEGGQCSQCQELIDENDQLRQQLETVEIMALNHQQNNQIKREMQVLQQRCILLTEQNQTLQKQVDNFYSTSQNEEHLVNSLNRTVQLPENQISRVQEFQNCMRTIELYIPDMNAQIKLKESLSDLQYRIEQLMNTNQISQMYDRLLVKYYTLLKQVNPKYQGTQLSQQKRQSESTPKKYEDEGQQRLLNQSLDSIGTEYKVVGKKPFQQRF